MSNSGEETAMEVNGRDLTMWHTVVPTSMGDLTLVRDAQAMRGLYYPHHWYRPKPWAFGPRSDDGFDDILRQLGEYLDGQRRDFNLPLDPRGDNLQQRVWAQVQGIAYGQTTTYGDLARRLGDGVTPQQIGAAVGRNPLCILIPCHRVVGRDGQLTGYAGGIDRKRRLLQLEQDHGAQTTHPPLQNALMPGLW
jgi:methylated-DNA-[protein]-cysteine S-methyltransferase